jgi:hypothetical protein
MRRAVLVLHRRHDERDAGIVVHDGEPKRVARPLNVLFVPGARHPGLHSGWEHRVRDAHCPEFLRCRVRQFLHDASSLHVEFAPRNEAQPVCAYLPVADDDMCTPYVVRLDAPEQPFGAATRELSLGQSLCLQLRAKQLCHFI